MKGATSPLSFSISSFDGCRLLHLPLLFFSPYSFILLLQRNRLPRSFQTKNFLVHADEFKATLLLLCIRGTVCRGLQGFLPGLLTRGTGDSFTSPLTQHLHGDGTTRTSATRQDGCQKPAHSAPGEVKSLLAIACDDFCGKDEKS